LFSDKYGKKSLLIQENEWQVLSQNWDVEVIKNRIIVRRASREITLVLRTEARKSIVIEKLDMIYEGVQLFCRENKEISISNKS
jgi:hypothetical protein